jgi:hypothetical protein
MSRAGNSAHGLRRRADVENMRTISGETDTEYDRKHQELELKHLARRAQKLDYTLTAVPATAPEPPPEPGG